jgi:lysophospholipase L1-like esterase
MLLNSLPPHVVILSLGGNDLDQGVSPSNFIKRISQFIIYLHFQLGINHIVLLQIPHRHRGPNDHHFNARVNRANFLFKQITNDSYYMHLWSHPNSGGPHLFARDGVHFNADPGMKNFYRSVRGAIICSL